MREARSTFIPINGLRYHVRTWGTPGQEVLVLLHGWMDVSASFQFVADALERDWYVVAPDWRGFGLTQWAPDGYWFPDYFADLDALLETFSPGQPAIVFGHSMGGNIAGMYAGIRPDRIHRLLLAEGFGLGSTKPEEAPARYARWLSERRTDRGFRSYDGIDGVVERLRVLHPRLTPERARFLAPHWSTPANDGRRVPAADPAHRRVNAVLYRQEEALACWAAVTAPVLWIWGGDPEWMRRLAGDDTTDWARRRNAFRHLTECTIADSAHMMHLDQPEALAAAIERFVDQCDASQTAGRRPGIRE
ncbi:MAG: alpha/beta fold hydrolase [Betaproteobacteria bacterium]|nr:alpha/beta fold hydrolase [Betaproteobacteria bacterium]